MPIVRILLLFAYLFIISIANKTESVKFSDLYFDEESLNDDDDAIIVNK